MTVSAAQRLIVQWKVPQLLMSGSNTHTARTRQNSSGYKNQHDLGRRQAGFLYMVPSRWPQMALHFN